MTLFDYVYALTERPSDLAPAAGPGHSDSGPTSDFWSVAPLEMGSIRLVDSGSESYLEPIGGLDQVADTPVPVPVAVPDLSGDGDGASVPAPDLLKSGTRLYMRPKLHLPVFGHAFRVTGYMA
jgi:hypothetical protein